MARGPRRGSYALRLLLWLVAGLLLYGDVAIAQPEAVESGAAQKPALQRASLKERVDEVTRELNAALGESGASTPEVASLRRLRDLLQRSDEALGVANGLESSRVEALRQAARDPSSNFAAKPPFPVPLLDAVFSTWEAQHRQSQRLDELADHRKETLHGAREDHENAEKARRRTRDELDRAKEPARRTELLVELRAREIDSRITTAELELAEINLANAELELAVQRTAEQHAAAILDWVQSNLVPQPSDLNDVLADLEKRAFDLDRALETTRMDLAAAGLQLEAAQSRAEVADAVEATRQAAEVAARRLQFTAAQRRVALLGERAVRLGLAKDSWQRRYRVLAADVSPEQARTWRQDALEQLDDLDRQRRIKRARLGELQEDLDELRGKILSLVTASTSADAAGGAGIEPDQARALRPWFEAQERDLLALIGLYRDDLLNLDEVMGLERRLSDELERHERGLAMTERLGRYREQLVEAWLYELTSSDDRPITVGKIVTALFIFAVGWVLARLMAILIGGRLLRRLGWDPGAVSAFESLFFYAGLAIAFLVTLRTVNIPLTAFAVAGGALALGIGFGSQAVVSNFISGLILLAERPIKAGDHVEVDGVYGMVERIGLRSTRVRAGDNFHIIVPNASFLERSVVNWTHDNTTVRLKVQVGVSYGSPTRRVEAALREVVVAHESTLADPEPMVLFMDFGESALLFEARFWITVRSLMDRLRIESDIRFAIDERFAAEGITIAFPQRDVHFDASGPIEVRLHPGDAGTES